MTDKATALKGFFAVNPSLIFHSNGLNNAAAGHLSAVPFKMKIGYPG